MKMLFLLKKGGRFGLMAVLFIVALGVLFSCANADNANDSSGNTSEPLASDSNDSASAGLSLAPSDFSRGVTADVKLPTP